MKTLIFTAHPSSKGFTHAIAERYTESAIKRGKTVETIDLYKTSLRQDYLEYEDIHMLAQDPKRDELQQKIKEADEIIFIHPVWWLSMPAIMKNFLDQVLLSGFAYKYTPDGKLHKLLKGKTAKVFMTCGASVFPSLVVRFALWMLWTIGILGFCGIKTTSFKMIFGMPRRSGTDKEKFLIDTSKSA